jgi:hypothetical protein
MPRHDAALDEAIREIAALLAAVYLRLRFADPQQKEVDSAETSRLHVTGG